MNEAPAKKQRPQYQVMEKSFLTDERLGLHRIYDPETMPFEAENPDDPDAELKRRPLLYFFDGIPGHNLRPVNDAAKQAWLDYWGTPYEETPQVDPIRTLSIVASRVTPSQRAKEGG